ncbi:hypothetical protein GCM10010275_71470 [Streptomyces litmocidini]|nr:hypothetical protein GCM10010275_71470 [Streptomyces litmocidini]
MAEEPGETRGVRLVDRELLPSAERDLRCDAGAGEVNMYAAGDRTERLVQLGHRLRAGQLHAGRVDGVGDRGEGQPSDRASERSDATHGSGMGVLELGQGGPQVARQILRCDLSSRLRLIRSVQGLQWAGAVGWARSSRPVVR